MKGATDNFLKYIELKMPSACDTTLSATAGYSYKYNTVK